MRRICVPWVVEGWKGTTVRPNILRGMEVKTRGLHRLVKCDKNASCSSGKDTKGGENLHKKVAISSTEPEIWSLNLVKLTNFWFLLNLAPDDKLAICTHEYKIYQFEKAQGKTYKSGLINQNKIISFQWSRGSTHWRKCGFSIEGKVIAKEAGRFGFYTNAAEAFRQGDLDELGAK